MQNNAMTAKVADPYAEALMSLAQAHNITEEIGDNIRSVLSILNESQDLKDFLENPLFKPEEKKSVLQRIFDNQINHYLSKFFLVLVDKRRIGLVEGICNKYLELLRKINNVVLAEVTSSVKLYEEETAKLSEKIKQLTGANAVEIQTKIDTDIIGGVIIKVGSQVYDASLKGQLRRISLSLFNAS